MKKFVMIPTYNEKENIEFLINEILKLKIPDLTIVVVDDNSPDGTGNLVRSLSKKDKSVFLLNREHNRGRGYAGKAGYLFCLRNGAEIIIEMDADLSHNPRYLIPMMDKLRYADVVLGSRRVGGSEEVGRGIMRRFITYFANFYIRFLLGVSVKDCNSGYRCFSRKALLSISPETIDSKGPGIVQEVLFKAYLKGLRIKEIPIVFVDRKKGKSKLGIKQLTSGYFLILKLKLKQLLGEI
tara:strand:- start:17752 stop:18468 length:717 start_codon:yes stop_codon:yes gene_type:complete